jgi:septal ring factor EnvC (AmiA/AmiB activator)
MWRSLPLVLTVACSVTPVLAATGEDPEWPCAQRLVPQLAPAVMWPGPPVHSTDGAAANPLIDELATELAARRVPIEQAKVQVGDFAQTLADQQRDEQLTRLFARTLEIINHDRSSIIQGIKKYVRGQRALAENITEKNERLSALPKENVAERDALTAERDWDVRIYDDRAKSLTYLCDQPVVLEQRAFALARAIASHLE